MLNVVTREEAVRIILEKIPEAADVETVGLPDALDKVVAEDILSPEDLPAYARSTVDGFAVRASDTYGCSEALPAMVTYAGKVLMGEDEKRVLPKASCMAVPTGGQVPEGADAVVMVEHSEDLGDEFRYMLKPVAPGENVNAKGDDIAIGGVAVPKGTMLEPRHTAVLAALGISELKVRKPLTVGILSTGDELVDYTETPKGTEIRISADTGLHEASITVADNGPGIPDGEKERVFEMFYSGSGNGPENRRSVGMGLSLCRAIVQAHGGEILLRDNIPSGAAFTFTLPLSEVDVHE